MRSTGPERPRRVMPVSSSSRSANCALAGACDDGVLVGREAELEALRHLPRDAALRQVRAGALGLRALAQDAVVERRGQRQELALAILAAPPGRDLGALLLVLQRHAEALCQPLDRGDEVECVPRAHVVDDVAADAAAVAVVDLLARVDVERGRPLRMERTAADPLGPRLAQLGVGAHELDDVGALAHRFQRGRCQPAAHGSAWANGISSSSKRRSA